MPRHRKVSYPRLDENNDVIPGQSYQVVENLTSAEELSRDAEQEQADVKRARRAVVDERAGVLQAKLSDDTITDVEIRELMRIEHGYT